MNETPLTQNLYSQTPADFLEGFTRVNRVRSTRMMSEVQRRAHAVHEARVASAAEFMADLMAGHIRSYYLQHPQGQLFLFPVGQDTLIVVGRTNLNLGAVFIALAALEEEL